MSEWLKTKRYVVFYPKVDRFISFRTKGYTLYRKRIYAYCPLGPYPEDSAIQFCRWVNNRNN